jgi:hypothetical protein
MPSPGRVCGTRKTRPDRTDYSTRSRQSVQIGTSGYPRSAQTHPPSGTRDLKRWGSNRAGPRDFGAPQPVRETGDGRRRGGPCRMRLSAPATHGCTASIGFASVGVCLGSESLAAAPVGASGFNERHQAAGVNGPTSDGAPDSCGIRRCVFHVEHSQPVVSGRGGHDCRADRLVRER